MLVKDILANVHVGYDGYLNAFLKILIALFESKCLDLRFKIPKRSSPSLE